MLYSGGEELVLILHGNSDLPWGLCGPALGCTVCKSSICCVPRNRPWPSVGTQCRLVSLKTQALPGLGFGGEAVLSWALTAELNPLNGKSKQPRDPALCLDAGQESGHRGYCSDRHGYTVEKAWKQAAGMLNPDSVETVV